MNGKFVLVILKAKEKKVKASQGNIQFNGILLFLLHSCNYRGFLPNETFGSGKNSH